MIYLKANINIPITYSLCGIFNADDKWIHMERIIDSYEIILVTKGTVFIQQGDEKFKLTKGSMLLLEPGIKHKGYDYSLKGTSFYWVHFYCNGPSIILNTAQVLSQISIYKNNPYFDEFDSTILIPTVFNNSNFNRLNILFHQLLHISQCDCYTNYSSDYILTSLLIEISQQVISSFMYDSNSNADNAVLNNILQWINMHITESISLKDLAYEFSFSKEYLARYFKSKMGMSMQTYINNLRISKGKDLLLKSDLNINEISKLLGFIDDKYFLKLFKKYENLTPKEFRNAYNKSYINNV